MQMKCHKQLVLKFPIIQLFYLFVNFTNNKTCTNFKRVSGRDTATAIANK